MGVGEVVREGARRPTGADELREGDEGVEESRGPSDSEISRSVFRNDSALRPRRSAGRGDSGCGSTPTPGLDGSAIGGSGVQTGRATGESACAESQASMKMRSRSERKENQRSRSGP